MECKIVSTAVALSAGSAVMTLIGEELTEVKTASRTVQPLNKGRSIYNKRFSIFCAEMYCPFGSWIMCGQNELLGNDGSVSVGN